MIPFTKYFGLHRQDGTDSKVFERSSLMLAAFMLVVAIVTPVLAGSATELGLQKIKAQGLLHTQAVLIAKLVKRQQQDDVAYLVFENVRVVRGNEPRKLLVFNHPTPTNHSGFIFNRILARDVALLKEGRSFLITLSKPYLPALTRWVLLPKKGQEDVIKKELKAYRELDQNLKRDPWKAVDDKNLFVQACALAYFSRHATRAELTKLLEDYAQGKRRSWMQHRLAWNAAKHVSEKDYDLDSETLTRIYKLGIGIDKSQGTRRMIQVLIVRRLENATSRDYDQIIVNAVNSKERDVRLAALHVLCRRKIPGCLSGIHKALAGIPSMFEPAHDRNVAAWALRFQTGKQSVDEVLRLCLEAQRDQEEQLRQSFAFLAQEVAKRHIPTLHAIDDPKREGLHIKVTELLVCAGEKEAQKEYLRLIKRGRIKRLPYKGDSRLLRHAAAWRESAKWMIASRHCADGSGFISCVEVLLHLHDPDLSDLVVPMVEDDHYHSWAMRYLVRIAQPQHRPIFQKHLKNKRSDMRAYAWAGLAALGDKDAMLKLAELTAATDNRMLRYYLTRQVLPRMDVKAITNEWAKRRPSKQTTVQSAVNAFVLERLKLIKTEQ